MPEKSAIMNQFGEPTLKDAEAMCMAARLLMRHRGLDAVR